MKTVRKKKTGSVELEGLEMKSVSSMGSTSSEVKACITGAHITPEVDQILCSGCTIDTKSGK